MTFDFNFRTLQSTKDLKQLVDFLMKQSLKYPKYEDWVKRSEYELYTGHKKAILAFSCGYLVGDLIYQSHKELPRTRELKNERVHPSVRNRYLANFMLRQVELENPEDFDAIICDVREGREAELNMLLRLGYKPIITTPLYDNHQDIILVKNIKQKPLNYIKSGLFNAN